MKKSVQKRVIFLSSAMFLLASTLPAQAHLPSYEGERVRNDNHFVDNGFAWPVRGECDFAARGATDRSAGSANQFLGPQNTPSNFFCLWATQDDWSFEYPIDIIESTRTPGPDPETIGQPLEEGYIPCSPRNPDPFQCPRELEDPTKPGEIIRLPGKCVDLGQFSDPSASPDPDGSFHCAVLPYAPRPRTSSVLFSTLTGPDDVDWGVYRYDSSFAEVPIVGAPQVPACKQSMRTFVTFAYAGPLGMRDARSGEELFRPREDAGPLPREVLDKLPEGYGIRVTSPSWYRPSFHKPRMGYASGFAQNAWLLAEDSVVECIDDFEKCLADESGELSKHYKYNDIFFVDEEESVDLYLMWWVDDDWSSQWPWKKFWKQRLTDVSITTGVIDQFIVGDYLNIGVTGPFSGNGRYIHGRCTDPRATGKADITIETN